MRSRSLIITGLLLLCVGTVSAQSRTDVNSPKAKQMLLGKHRLSLQWIRWDYFGTATVTERKGVLYLTGRQSGRVSTDFVTVDGMITAVNDKDFTFVGKIVTQITHINGCKPCTRDGEYNFRITGKRKYWRMQEIDSPCDVAADYVDVYFR